ncbi:dorsal-ventral patterning protein tolloid-like [Glandiceps talaboti]
MLVTILWLLASVHVWAVGATGRCGESSLVVPLNSTSTITSPNYPSHYGETEKCKWQIYTPDGERIVIQFQTFAVGDFDAVRLFTGRSDPDGEFGKKEFKRLQGSDPVGDILMLDNYGWIIFQTFDLNSYPGFHLLVQADINNCAGKPCRNGGTCIERAFDFNCECPKEYSGKTCDIGRCGDEDITLPAGQTTYILSPNHPFKYLTKENCHWTIASPDGDAIFLHFLDFATEDQYDKLTIGMTGSDDDIYNLSGITVPQDILLFTSSIWLKFISDGGNNYRGFKIELTADVDNCFPNPCLHGGTCGNGKFSFTCNCPIGYGGNLCQLTSNNCDRNPCQNSGTCRDLEFDFECECPAGFGGKTCDTNLCGAENITVDINKPFTVSTPRYPNQYDNKLSCTWIVYANTGSEIIVTFLDYDIADFGDVIRIGVGMKPGENMKAEFSKVPNGGKKPDNIQLAAVNVWITFDTGMYQTAKGFQLDVASDINNCLMNPCRNGGTCINGAFEYKCECNIAYEGNTCEINRCGNSEIELNYGEKYNIASPNYPGNYLNDEYCEWKIRALGVSNEIVIKYMTFDTEENADFLRIGSGTTIRVDQRVYISGAVSSTSYDVIDASNAWVVFESDDSDTASGFQLEVIAGDNCEIGKDILYYPEFEY